MRVNFFVVAFVFSFFCEIGFASAWGDLQLGVYHGLVEQKENQSESYVPNGQKCQLKIFKRKVPLVSKDIGEYIRPLQWPQWREDYNEEVAQEMVSLNHTKHEDIKFREEFVFSSSFEPDRDVLLGAKTINVVESETTEGKHSKTFSIKYNTLEGIPDPLKIRSNFRTS